MLFLFAFSWQSTAQTPDVKLGGTPVVMGSPAASGAASGSVSPGNGTAVDKGLPVDPYYGYSYSQCIYLQSEIQGAGDITTLTWDVKPGTDISNSNDWTIYIGHTTKSEFTSSTDWVDVSTLTQVFSGIVTIDANNKVVVDITDFTYNNTDNLIIAVDENASDFNGSSDDFYCYATATDRGIRYRNDNNNPDPTAPPSGTAISYVANIELGGITSTVVAPGCASNPIPADNALDVDVESTGGALTLYWDAPTTGDAATSYEVFIGTTSGSLSSLGSVAVDSINLTGFDFGTQYYWSVVPANAGGAATGCTEWTFTTANATAYCTPAPTSVDNNGLTGVVFSTINNQTTEDGTYYHDYTSMVGDVTAGGTENIAVTLETGYTYDVWVWIDWNDDNDFSDAGEAMYIGEATDDNPTTLNGTFSVPASATAGHHRLRIGVADSGLGSTNGNPCYSGSYGEFEDYTVNVVVPSCIGVTNIVASSITTNSANITWDANGNSAWEVVVQAMGTGVPSGSGTPVTAASYNATGLSASTDYEVYVRTDCGGGSFSDWAGPTNFTTLTPAPSNDLCANPITLTLDVNACGGNTITGISNAGTTDSGEPAPSCGSYGTPTSLGDLWYAITIPAGVTDITLDVANITGMTSVAGAIYSGSCGSLTELDCTQFGSGWPWDITGLTGGDTYLLRVWDYGNDQEGTFDLCGYYVTCPTPTDLAVANITETGVEVSWTSGGSDWEVVIQPDGTGTPTGAGIATTSNPYTVNNLSAGTDYEVYVRNNCGSDFSAWVGPVTFTTLTPAPSNDLCANPITLTLDVNACGGNTITGISNAGTTDSGEPAPSCGSYGTPTSLGDLWYAITIPAGVTDITLDVANITGMTSVAGAIYSGSCGSLTELDCTQFGSGWPWDITGLTGGDTYLLRVWDYGNDQEGTFDLCGYYVTCPTPTDLAVANITETGVEVSWTSGGSDWEVVIQPDGTGTPTGAGIATTSNPYTVNNLSAGTDYEVYVRNNCGSDFSAWVGPVSFTTLSPPPANDLCADAVVLTCAAGTSTGVNVAGATDTDKPDISACTTTGTIGAGVWYSFTGTGDLVTITADPTGWDPELVLLEGSCGSMSCVQRADDHASGTAEVIADFQTTAGTNYLIYVCAYSSSSSHNGTVDVSITCPATCNAPTAVTVSSITATDAEISWVTGGATAWEVAVVASGAGAPAAGDPTTTNPYAVTGLDACTGYDVYVRDDCGSGLYSDWSAVGSFTTLSTLAAIDIANQSVCASATTVDLTALEPAGQTGGAWSIGGTLVVDPTSETVADGNVYTYTLTDGACVETDDVTYTVNPNPVVAISDMTICASENPVDLGALEPVGQTGGTWSVTSPYTAGDGDNVSYTYVDGNGCSGSDNMTFTVNPNPVVTIADQTINDTDNPFDLTSIEPAGQTGGTWSVTSPATIADGDTYTYTFTDANGCSGSTDVTFTVNTTSSCPSAGAVIITEIMKNPAAVGDGSGEWFEVYNTTGAAIDMNGWTIKDDGANSHVIGASLVVPAGGYAVLGNNADSGTNGGVTVNYEYSGFSLGNGADEVVLVCSGSEIDRVNYNDADFPDDPGASLTLNPTKFNATDNDDGANWCSATTAYGDGDLGTPGAANDNCGGCTPPVIEIDDMVLCASESTVTLTDLEPATQTGGTWTFGGSVVSGSVTVSDGDVYTYAWTDPNTSCEGTDNVTFTVNANPVVNVSDVTICASENPVDLTALEPTGQTGGSWSAATPYTAADGDVVTYTYVDANGCEGTGDATFTVNANPTVSVSDVTICANENPVDLTALEPTGQTGGSWSAATPYTAADGDVVTYTYVDANGCEGTGDATFTVLAVPVVVIADQTIDAADNPFDLTSLEPAGQTGGTWSATSPVNIADGDVYTYTWTDANGCQGSVDVTFTVNATNPVPSCTTIVSPADGATDVSVNANLLWNAVANADGYTLTVGTTAGGNDIVDHLDVTSAYYMGLGTLPYGQDIYVSIIPYNTAGNASECTFFTFTTEDQVIEPITVYYVNTALDNYGWMPTVTIEGCGVPPGFVGLPFTGGIHEPLTEAQFAAQNLTVTGGCAPLAYEYWDIITNNNPCSFEALRAFKVTDACGQSHIVKQMLNYGPPALTVMQTSTNTAIGNYGFMTDVTGITCNGSDINGLPLTGGVHQPLTLAQMNAQDLSVAGGCNTTYEYWDIILDNGTCATGMHVLRAFRVSSPCATVTVKQNIFVDGVPVTPLGLTETSTGTALSNYGFMSPATVQCAGNGDVDGLALTNGVHHSLTAAEFAAQDLTVTGACPPMTYEYWDIKTGGTDCASGMTILRAFRVSGACGTYTVKKMITVDGVPVAPLGLTETSTGTALSNYGFMSPATVQCAGNGDVDGLALTNGVHHSLTAAEFAAQDLTVTGACPPMTYEYWDIKTGGTDCASGMTILRAFRVSGACGTYTVKKMITVNAASVSCSVDMSQFTLVGSYNGHTYYISNAIMNWGQAATLAAANGGYIASVTSAGENAFIAANVNEMVLLGLNDQANEGTFVWDNGEAVSYVNFDPYANPNNASSDFVVMQNWNDKWSLVNMWVAKKFILEADCNANQAFVGNNNSPIQSLAASVSPNDLSVSLSPNPASDVINVKVISSIEGSANVQLINSQGVLVQDVRTGLAKGANDFSYDISELPTGVYFLKVTNSETQKIERFIVR